MQCFMTFYALSHKLDVYIFNINNFNSSGTRRKQVVSLNVFILILLFDIIWISAATFELLQWICDLWFSSNRFDRLSICDYHQMIDYRNKICLYFLPALVFDKCTRHDQCPQNSKCRPTGCDGYTCRCDPNYVHSHNRASCLPG